MCRFLSLLVLVAVAAFAGVPASATAPGLPLGLTGVVDVQYDAVGPVGSLSVIGDVGTHFRVYDVNGLAVAEGILDAPFVSLQVSNSGVGPAGELLWVTGAGAVLVVIDPEWDWN